jgi:hypothetical protein
MTQLKELVLRSSLIERMENLSTLTGEWRGREGGREEGRKGGMVNLC